MLRILFCLLCCFSVNLMANTPLSLNKSLTPSTKERPAQSNDQLFQLEKALEEQLLTEQNFRLQNIDFEKISAKLSKDIIKAKKELTLSKKGSLTQQASLAYLTQSELKQRETSLSETIASLSLRQQQLPDVITTAKGQLSAHSKTALPAITSSNGQVQQLQRKLLSQQVSTLQTELNTSPQRLELTQMELTLVRAQLLQQEHLIELLNAAMGEHRQKETDAAIAKSQTATENLSHPELLAISEENRSYAAQLKSLNDEIDNIVKRQELAEKRYQTQTQQLSSVKEQIAWVRINSAFGERFLLMLQSLPTPVNPDTLQNSLAASKVEKYQIEQQLIKNEQRLALPIDEIVKNQRSKLVKSQILLLNALKSSLELKASELTKLTISYEQLGQLHKTLKNTLSEQLFWVPNASKISKSWFNDIAASLDWLAQDQQWQELEQATNLKEDTWSWWIILLVLSLVVQDTVSPRFERTLKHYANNVGNVTQDSFIYTLKALVVSISYTLILPISIIAAGLILYDDPINSVSALGAGVTAIGSYYLLYLFIKNLCREDGILIGHFKRPKDIITLFLSKFRRFYIQTLPLIAIMASTQVLTLSLVRNSVGRGAFILFCIMLFLFYKELLQLSKQYREFHLNGKNKQLLQKLLWLVLIVTPLVSAILASQGYYYSAFQVLMQLQVSLLLGLGVLLLYQLIKRWMLIARRQIAFERAKTKRAEQVAARERGEVVTASNDPMDNYEEPQIDLETISSQSLGLVRSLLTLALLAGLIGLWTQTHTALFSFFDGITLWTSSATIDGIDQQVPVTIKSVLLGLIIMGFSLMIATNLPGLLELVVLQRFDLTPGTGFAITTVGRYLVVFFGLLIGFSTLGMQWSKLQWLVAALSVGLGFGLQEIFANFISGLIILFEKPIRIGDTVTIRELTGTVSKIQIRATTIIDWDRKEIIVPNKAFITEQLVNWSLSDPITRVIIYVSVARDSDPARVEAALYQAVEECEDALPNPEPEVWFAGFGQHTQDFEVRAYAKDMASRWPLKHRLHKQISKKLSENGLELAYPQLEIHLNNGPSTNAVKETSLIRS